ncbi:hypothetical protein H8356DRAFT_1632337 [Neocallimastix lanati (nom. inval.)]|jgi:hypothetical protein|nr:hypothetical protein H8356DRAFT_1632337 [Neocallimastix sp. JGI-2020a]
MIVDWFIFLLVCYVVVDFFCINTTIEEDDSDGRLRNLTAVVVIPNDANENKPEDDLPPYTPPTPKTQAAFADLPPSYDETWDITETNINENTISRNNTIRNNTNTNNSINDNNVNSTINNNINNNAENNINIRNLPAYNVNINSLPEVVVNPVNPNNNQAPQVA